MSRETCPVHRPAPCGDGCPNSPDAYVRRAIQDLRANAWDEGYDAGDPYHRRGNPDNAKLANPYRATDSESP